MAIIFTAQKLEVNGWSDFEWHCLIYNTGEDSDTVSVKQPGENNDDVSIKHPEENNDAVSFKQSWGE